MNEGQRCVGNVHKRYRAGKRRSWRRNRNRREGVEVRRELRDKDTMYE